MDIDNSTIDYSTRELLHLKPILRDDIKISHQQQNGADTYIIEDPARSKFYRIGLAEYRFVSLLNGHYSIGQALAQVARDLGSDALTEHDTAVIVHWLLEMELVMPESGTDTEELHNKQQRRKDNQILKRLNLLFIKVPFFNPDRFLDKTLPYLSWMLGRRFFIFWLLVVISGIYQLLINSEKFSVSAGQIFSIHNWLWLFLSWLILKVIHELFHALVCKKYGGNVYEAGAIFVLFAPIGYVDATSAWWFTSKWHRMFTAAAGMYIEFFIFGIFAWIWAAAEPGVVRDIAYNIIIIASLNTFLFNANPLMKFDGYYIFSDFFDISNLYGEGNNYVKYLSKKYLLGLDVEFPQRPRRDDLIIKTYGVLSFLWRILVIATLLIIANTLFYGAGVLLVITSVTLMFGLPAIRFIRSLFADENETEKPEIKRFATTVLGGTLLLFILLTQVTVSRDVIVPAVVDYRQVDNIHAKTEGFVERYFVQDGQTVQANQPLLQLSNDELTAEVASLKLQLRALSISRMDLLVKQEIASLQSVDKKIAALRAEYQQKQKGQDLLLITAPSDGVVLLPNVEKLLGRYISQQNILATVVSSSEKELKLSINQRDIDYVADKVGSNVYVYIDQHSKKLGTLQSIAPGASVEISQPALTAIGGGSLPVTQAKHVRKQQYVLLQPRFDAQVALSATEMLQLTAGERGVVEISGNEVGIAVYWQQKVSDWVENVISQI